MADMKPQPHRPVLVASNVPWTQGQKRHKPRPPARTQCR